MERLDSRRNHAAARRRGLVACLDRLVVLRADRHGIGLDLGQPESLSQAEVAR